MMIMTCEHCGGFTIAVSFSGGVTATGAWEYAGSKCLNCGYITDPLILKNRAAQSQRTGHRTSKSASGRIRPVAEIAA